MVYSGIMQRSFYFMRHGETDWNRRNVYMGSQDIPLNEAGIEQAKLAALQLKQEPIGHIVTSPLSRAFTTAKIVGEVIQKPVTVIENLRECSLGTEEGQTKDNKDLLDRWFSDNLHGGAESFSSFKMRIEQGLAQALSLPGLVLIVAHGGVYHAMHKILDLPFADLANCKALYYKPPCSVVNSWLASEV